MQIPRTYSTYCHKTAKMQKVHSGGKALRDFCEFKEDLSHLFSIILPYDHNMGFKRLSIHCIDYRLFDGFAVLYHG